MFIHYAIWIGYNRTRKGSRISLNIISCVLILYWRVVNCKLLKALSKPNKFVSTYQVQPSGSRDEPTVLCLYRTLDSRLRFKTVAEQTLYWSRLSISSQIRDNAKKTIQALISRSQEIKLLSCVLVYLAQQIIVEKQKLETGVAETVCLVEVSAGWR